MADKHAENRSGQGKGNHRDGFQIDGRPIDVPGAVMECSLDADDLAWLSELARMDAAPTADDVELKTRQSQVMNAISQRLGAYDWWWVLSAVSAEGRWPVSLKIVTYQRTDSPIGKFFTLVAYIRYVYGYDKFLRRAKRDHKFRLCPEYEHMIDLSLGGEWWIRSVGGMIASGVFSEEDVKVIHDFHKRIGGCDRVYMTGTVAMAGAYHLVVGPGFSRRAGQPPFSPRDLRLIVEAVRTCPSLRTRPRKHRDAERVGRLAFRFRWLWPLVSLGLTPLEVAEESTRWIATLAGHPDRRQKSKTMDKDTFKRYIRKMKKDVGPEE